MVGFHHFATGLHRGRKTMAEATLVAAIRAIMIYVALLHTLLLWNIRGRKRQIDILVNIKEDIKIGIEVYSSLSKEICLRDR